MIIIFFIHLCVMNDLLDNKSKFSLCTSPLHTPPPPPMHLNPQQKPGLKCLNQPKCIPSEIRWWFLNWICFNSSIIVILPQNPLNVLTPIQLFCTHSNSLSCNASLSTPFSPLVFRSIKVEVWKSLTLS